MPKFQIELSHGKPLIVDAADEKEARAIAEKQIGPGNIDIGEYASGIVKEGVKSVGDAASGVRGAVASLVSPEALRKRATEGPSYVEEGKNLATVALSPAAVPLAGLMGAGRYAVGKPMSEIGEVVEQRMGGDRTAEQLYQEMSPGIDLALSSVGARAAPSVKAGPAPATPPQPAPTTAPAGGGAFDALRNYVGKVPPEVAGSAAARLAPTGTKTLAKSLTEWGWGKLQPELPPAPQPTTSVPVTKPPARQMPWGGPMPTEPVTSVPSMPLSPEAVMARVQRMADEGVDATQGSPLPEVSKDVVKSVMAEMRTRNRADRMRDMNAAKQAGRTEASAPVTTPAPAAPAELPPMAAPAERAARPTQDVPMDPRMVETLLARRNAVNMFGPLGNDYIRPLPGARRDIPMDPAMLQALIARGKPPAPAPAPAPMPSAPPPVGDGLDIPGFLRRTPQAATPPAPAPMPPQAAMPPVGDGLDIPGFLRRTPQAAPPPQPKPSYEDTVRAANAAEVRARIARADAAPPQTMPPGAVSSIPDDLSIPAFLDRRNPAVITKKDGKVEAKMEPALTKPTQKYEADRGEALRKEKADADTFNTMKVEAGDDLYLPAHSAARNGRTPAEAAQHIADQWKLEGKPFGTDEASFVSRLTKLMAPKFELADDLAKATGADKGILRERLIGPMDADGARQFRTDLSLSFPSASRRIDEVMSDDRIVGTWPKYKQKGGKPKTPVAARRKPTKKGSGASTAG